VIQFERDTTQRRNSTSDEIRAESSLDNRIAKAELRAREQSRHIVRLLAEGRDTSDACAILAMMLMALEQMCEVRDMLYSFGRHP
jgi:hypothetical protein